MAGRVGPIASPGSLLKNPRRTEKRRDDSHLNLIRRCFCLTCLSEGPCDAAHIRYHDLDAGKDQTGIGRKPEDRWTVPLCHDCHMKQHARGERQWWKERNIDPIVAAKLLYHASPNLAKMLTLCIRIRIGELASCEDLPQP